MKVLFVTNFCPHYLIKPFEAIGRLGDVRFLFYSDGGEDYWEAANMLRSGDFKHRYLPGFYLGRKVRVTPGLISEIMKTDADAVVVSVAGRFAIPTSYLLARLRRKKVILWSGLWSHPDSLFHRLTASLTRRLYRNSDAILVYGEHVKRYLVELGCDPKKIFLFSQSVDIARMGRIPDPIKRDDWKKRWSPNGDPIILSVGRLDPQKGLRTLLEAFALIKVKTRARLVLVGRGSEKKALVDLARERGITPIFENYIPNEELPEVYAAADVFCLPSETLPMVKEPWGLVLNEAMLQGCVPVASDAVGAAVGGLIPDELAHLVSLERNPAALAEKLLLALDLARDPDLRERIREKARFFSPENQAQGLAEAYRFVMS